MSVSLIVLKDFDKEGTVHVDMSKVDDPWHLFRICAAAAPYWIEVVNLCGRSKEKAFEIYGEYSPSKEVTAKELQNYCMQGEYDFGKWIFNKKPERKGWKVPLP